MRWQQRWQELWRRLGATTIPRPESLLASWKQPQRHYHDVRHLRACLRTYDRQPRHDDAVEMALWFHDAVYDPRADDNEERSSAWAVEAAISAGLTPSRIRQICSCIQATQHRNPPPSWREALVQDVDLAILAAVRPAFIRYEQGIRQEYAWVPKTVYRRERSRILRGFLDRRWIYHTSWGRENCEPRARRNLAWLLERLDGTGAG